jgi:lipopolysaccharide assembly outer membrane protein LptD (OstA)
MFHSGHKLQFLLLLLWALPFGLTAQNKAEVKIIQADTWKNNQNIVKNANRLLGNVIIDHADIRMWCDSAYMYTDTNIVDAFGRVHILKADTLNLYARYIRYNGDNRQRETHQ